MFGTAEGIQVSKYGIAFNLTRVLYAQMVGVGVHALHFFLNLVGGIGKVDTVAQRLAHLGFSVRTRQAQTGCIVRQKDFRLHQRVAVDEVEAAYDFTGLFNHRFLVFADGNGGGAERCNVRGLADGVGEEPYRNTRFKVAHLDFRLYRRVALQARYGDKVHIIESQFAQFRYLRLDEDGTLRRVQSASQIVEGYLDNVLTYFFRILHVVCQCLRIGDEHECLVIQSGVLQLHSASQRAYIMSDVQASCGAVAREDDFFFCHICIYYFFLISKYV